MTTLMNRPPSLIGTAVAGAYICKDWELRITARCLDEDLNAAPGSPFESVVGLEIVKAMISAHEENSFTARDVSPLTSGETIWVLTYGHDHRGGTFYDESQQVIWLVAYHRHRAHDPDDFFPYCTELDSRGCLLPTLADYERMFKDRDRRFADAVVHEAPMIIRDAERAEGEYRCTVGGELGVGLSIEIDDELEARAMTVAFDATEVETFEQGQLLLVALHPGPWELAGAMPSRDLAPSEVAFTIIHSPSGEAL
jgi:hypothetical protein